MNTEDVTGDYSCGECGWWGYLENCIFEPENENNPEGDGKYVCPICRSERVGEITWEDFEKHNALHGHTWRGEKKNNYNENINRTEKSSN